MLLLTVGGWDGCANWGYRYFVVGNLAADEEEVVRISGLLRGMESAVQAVSVSFSICCVDGGC